MFCASLRRRPSLDGLVPHLTSASHSPLRETNLSTYDLSLPLHQHPTARHDSTHHKKQIFLILTPSALLPANKPNTLTRVDRFVHLVADPTPAIAFLLSTPIVNKNTTNGLAGFMQFQMLLHHPSPPLLPIPHPSSVLPALTTYTNALATPTHTTKSAPAQALALLHHTTTSPRGVSEHGVHVLSDLCSSMTEVMELARARGGEMVSWLGNEEGRGVGGFWGGGGMVREGEGEEEDGEEVMLLDDDTEGALWVDRERGGYVLREEGEEGYEDDGDGGGGTGGSGRGGGYGDTRRHEEGFEEIDRLLEMGR